MCATNGSQMNVVWLTQTTVPASMCYHHTGDPEQTKYVGQASTFLTHLQALLLYGVQRGSTKVWALLMLSPLCVDVYVWVPPLGPATQLWLVPSWGPVKPLKRLTRHSGSTKNVQTVSTSSYRWSGSHNGDKQPSQSEPWIPSTSSQHSGLIGLPKVCAGVTWRRVIIQILELASLPLAPPGSQLQWEQGMLTQKNGPSTIDLETNINLQRFYSAQVFLPLNL